MRAAFITDEDQFTDSKHKEYNLDRLVENDYAQLRVLREGINGDHVNGRVANMNAMRNGQADVRICSGKKTLEYQICKANVSTNQETTKDSWLYELIRRDNADGIGKVDTYLQTLGDRNLSEEEQQNVALLMWKCLPGKAGFAQTLNTFLLNKMDTGEDVKFTVPSYIQEAINHLVP